MKNQKKLNICLILSFVFGFFSFGFSQNESVDELEKLLEQSTSTEQKIELIHQLVDAYLEVDLDKAMANAEKAVALAEKEGITLRLADALLLKSRVEEMKSLYDSAHLSVDKSIEIFEALGGGINLASAMTSKADLFITQGKFNQAIELDMAALDILEKNKNEIGTSKKIAKIYLSLTGALYYQNQYKEGVKYGKLAIEEFKSIKDSSNLTAAYNFAGMNYIGLKEYDTAILLLDQSIQISKIILSPNSIEYASALNGRGNAYKNGGLLDKALIDYEEAYQIVEALDHQGGISAVSANLSDIYLRKKNYQKALPYVQKAVDLMEANGYWANILENYQNISHIYENLGDYKHSTKYLKKYNFARDSLATVDQDVAVVELRTKYETEKKEVMISLQEEKISRQDILQKFGLAAIVLLGLVLFLSYRNAKNKKQANERIIKAHKLLENKNAENELLLKEIHHRVKNNLQTISSLLSLQSQSISDPTALDAVQESQNRVTSMALIHQKLYQGENLAAIEMKDYFKTIGESIMESFGANADKVQLKVVMEELELDVDTAIPIGLITNELMTNSLKYAFKEKAKGKVTISMKKGDDNMIHFSITDDGNFDNSSNLSKEGTGFGSLLIQLLTTQLDGQLEQNTTAGTATILRFPMRDQAVA